MRNVAIVLQALVAASIFFVWAVRYANIVEEFRQYGLPTWLRDLVGIVKTTCAVLLLVGISRPDMAVLGALGIAALMLAAVATHLRVKNPVGRMLPALTLLLLCLAIGWMNSRPMPA